MNRISACLITLNEEQNLSRALASLECVADEIVVVDTGSVDRTEDIAREHGAVFLVRQWTNYGEQKNVAAARATYDWILSLDADEELSPSLKTSLLAWKKSEPKYLVYEMARLAWYAGGWIRHSGWYPDYQRRLYRRDAGQFSGIVHESLRFEGKPGRLEGDLLHYTVRSFEEHEEKVQRYAALAAQQMYAAGRRRWRAAMWLAAPWNGFKGYVLGLGFLDGHRGRMIAKMAARGTWLKFKNLEKLIKAERRFGETKMP